jgi:hypothetical protein
MHQLGDMCHVESPSATDSLSTTASIFKHLMTPVCEASCFFDTLITSHMLLALSFHDD